jgi:hypothetical protein
VGGEFPGCLHVGFGQINHGDVAAELNRQRTRRSSEAASHVQYAEIRRQTGELGESSGGWLAASVKMIHESQVVYGQCVQVFTCCGEGIKNRLS